MGNRGEGAATPSMPPSSTDSAQSVSQVNASQQSQGASPPTSQQREPRQNRPPRADRPDDAAGGEQRRSRRGGRRRGRGGRGRGEGGTGAFEGSGADSASNEARESIDGGGSNQSDNGGDHRPEPSESAARPETQRSFDLSAERPSQDRESNPAPRAESSVPTDNFQPREQSAAPTPSGSADGRPPVKVWTSSPAPTSGSFGGGVGGRGDRE